MQLTTNSCSSTTSDKPPIESLKLTSLFRSLANVFGKDTGRMSTIMRTLRNLRRVGLRDAAHQMQNIGDTKAGKLIGTDMLGNKYFENLEEELPRTQQTAGVQGELWC